MGKQMEVPGTERPHGDEELDALAEAFKKSSKKRKAAQDAELAAREILVDAMKKKKVTVYEDKRVEPPLLVTLTSLEKVTVKEIDEAAADDDDFEDMPPPAPIDQKARKKTVESMGA